MARQGEGILRRLKSARKGLAAGIAAFLLSACGLLDPDYAAARGQALTPLEAGTGFIWAVAVVPGARPSGDPASDTNAYRLFVALDNGGSRTVDVDSAEFLPGQRVLVTAEGRVVGF